MTVENREKKEDLNLKNMNKLYKFSILNVI